MQKMLEEIDRVQIFSEEQTFSFETDALLSKKKLKKKYVVLCLVIPFLSVENARILLEKMLVLSLLSMA